MKVSIDLDGTLTEFPERYKKLIDDLKSCGNEVHILTGRKPDTIIEDMAKLHDMGIQYDSFINSGYMNDYEKQVIKWAIAGHISVDRDEVVCMWKAREIVDRCFDIVIDDAADKIRLYLDRRRDDNKVTILKSPTLFNQVFPKWGKDHIVDYSDKES